MNCYNYNLKDEPINVAARSLYYAVLNLGDKKLILTVLALCDEDVRELCKNAYNKDAYVTTNRDYVYGISA